MHLEARDPRGGVVTLMRRAWEAEKYHSHDHALYIDLHHPLEAEKYVNLFA